MRNRLAILILSCLLTAALVLSAESKVAPSQAEPAPSNTIQDKPGKPSKDKPSKPKLSARYQHWLDDEVVWIISKYEREAFESLPDDTMRDAFMSAFWDARDPTPGTTDNEFKTEHYKRIVDANKQFGRSKSKPGSKSPRGRLYVQLGPPRYRDQYPSETRLYPLERWFYQADRRLGIPPFFHVIFFRPFGAGDYEMYEPGIHGPEDLVGGMTANASEFQDERQQGLRQLKHVSAELWRASLSLIPTDPVDPDQGRIEPGSQLLVAQLHDIQNSMPVDRAYVERVLSGNPNIQIEYSFRDLGLVGTFHGTYLPGGLTLLHYGVELPPGNLTLSRYNDKISGVLEVLGRVFKADGKTPVLQIDERIELSLNDKELERVKRSPFAYQAVVPLLPGSYRATLVVRNAVTREFGSLEMPFVIPAVGAVGLAVPEPLWVSHGRDVAGAGDLPFVFAGKQWYPNSRRTVGLDQESQILVQAAYDRTKYGLGDDIKVFWYVDAESQPGPTQGSVRLRVNPTFDGGQVATMITLPAQRIALGPHELYITVEGHAESRVEYRQPFTVGRPAPSAAPWIYATRLEVDVAAIPVIYADQYLAMGDEDSAIREFERALAGVHSTDDVRLRLGELLLSRREFGRAEKALRPAADRSQAGSYPLMLLGMALSGSGDVDGAMRAYQQAVEQSPRSIQVLNLLGEEQLRAGNTEQARASLERSIALEPDQPKIRELLKKAGALPTQ